MRPSRCLSVSVSLAALWLAATPGVARSQGPPVIEKLQPAGLEMYDYFGQSASMAGDLLVVGAPGDDDADPDAGALYVYSRFGGPWVLAQKLYAQDGGVETWGDYLGRSVALRGNLIASGAPYDTNPAGVEAGSVYLFANQGGTWVQVQRLYTLDCDDHDHFGLEMTLSDNVLVVTASDSFDPFGDSAVFVFEPQGGEWVQTAALVPMDGVTPLGDGPVAASDDMILVGAPHATVAGAFKAGAVHVFEKIGGAWQETDVLTAPVPELDSYFGRSLALDGSRLLVGAPMNSSTVQAGEAYVFERSLTGWTHVATLTPNEVAEDAGFGSAVALEGDRAAVGNPIAPASEPPPLGSGRIHEYALLSGTWTHVAHILPPDPVFTGGFGQVLSMFGQDLFAGTPNQNGPAGEPEGYGAVYVIQQASPIEFLDLGYALAGVDGLPQLSATGTLLPGELVQVALTNGKPLALGALVLGATQAYVPLRGGTLVPSLDAMVPVATDAFGTGGLAGAWPAGVPSGAIVSMQWWTADAAGVNGFASSNAIGILAP